MNITLLLARSLSLFDIIIIAVPNHNSCLSNLFLATTCYSNCNNSLLVTSYIDGIPKEKWLDYNI